MDPIKKGSRLNAKLINRIIAQANRGGSIAGGKGIGARSGPGGSILTEDAVGSLLTEPAHEVLVMNEGTTLIPALSPAGIVQSLGQSDGELYTERVLRVRTPKAEDAGNFVIAQNEIPPNGMGWAWCGGVCLVRLMRWFESDQLERADILAGEQYALASVDGGLDILWSQRTTATTPGPIVSTEHLAIVRFNGRRFHLWLNGGTVTAAYGQPIVPKVSDTSGVVDGTRFDVLSCRTPLSADSKLMSYINVGGNVAAGEYGRCTTGDSLVRAKAAYNAGQSVGAETGQAGISSAGSGYVIMARLGTFQSINYAIARIAGGSSSLYTLTIDRGNTLSDGSTLGIKWTSPAPTTVPTLYDPTVDSSFIDGVGRATLKIDNVSLGLVLVAHYTGNGSSLTLAVWQNQIHATSPATITLPLASDPTQTVSLYVPHTP